MYSTVYCNTKKIIPPYNTVYCNTQKPFHTIVQYTVILKGGTKLRLHIHNLAKKMLERLLKST